MAWNDLSLPDKARMMQLAVKSGITDLRDIQEVYNKYAEGGELGDPEYINSDYFTLPKKSTVQIPYRDVKVTDEELVDSYLDNVLWKMENPRYKGYNKEDGLFYAYTDVDADGNTHVNIGPGLEQNGHPNIDYTRGYTKAEIDRLARKTVENRVRSMSESLQSMQDGKYAVTRDTLSMGPLLSMVDIAYNARTAKKKNLPEKWPTLVKHLANGDLDRAKEETYSGSKRRQKMRNDLLTYSPITASTVKNR